MPVLTVGDRLDLAAKLVGDQLHAVTNAQYGNTSVEHPRRGHRRAVFIDAVRTAGKNHADNVLLVKDFATSVVRNNLAVGVGLSNSPCDQSRVLGTEIDDDYRLRLDIDRRVYSGGAVGLCYLKICPDLDVVRSRYPARCPVSWLSGHVLPCIANRTWLTESTCHLKLTTATTANARR